MSETFYRNYNHAENDGTRIQLYRNSYANYNRIWISLLVIFLSGTLAILGEFNNLMLIEVMGFAGWGIGLIELFKKENKND